MPAQPEEFAGEEARISIDLPENDGLVTDNSKALICDLKINYDIHPAAIQFEMESQTLHRKGNLLAQIPVIRTANLKVRVADDSSNNKQKFYEIFEFLDKKKSDKY